MATMRVMKVAIASGLLAAGFSAALPVQAQTGFVRPDRTDGVPMEGASRCPQRWQESSRLASDERVGYCYPSYANSPSIMRRTGSNCPSGYGVDGEWCSQGHIEHPLLNNPNVMAKAHQADRCPAGFYTYLDKCTTELARPPKARVKGAALAAPVKLPNGASGAPAILIICRCRTSVRPITVTGTTSIP